MRTFAQCLVAPAIGLALAVSGCTASDRAGGNAAVQATETRFAVRGAPASQIVAWVTEVEQRSRGTLKVTYVSDQHATQPDYEALMVADVQAGAVDFAWVGARAFDQVGLTSFQPLLAPLLIDSLELQGKVFDAGIPQRLLPSLERIGLVGVGILPGPLRRVLGKKKPFTRAADFVGQVVGVQASAVADQTFRALRATTRAVPAGTQLTGLDAYEQQLGSIHGNHYVDAARYVTGNLNLWPRPLVIVANPSFYRKLTDDQRAVMSAAAEDGIQVAQDAEQRGDADAITALCRAGLSFAQSTEGDLKALRAALEPVYESIRRQVGDAETLQQIAAIAAQLHRGPDAAACNGTPSAEAPLESRYDGTYRMEVKWPEVDTPEGRCMTGPEAGSGGSVYEMEFHQGTMELWVRVGGPGAPRELGDEVGYRFFKDQLQFHESDGSTTMKRPGFGGGSVIWDRLRREPVLQRS